MPKITPKVVSNLMGRWVFVTGHRMMTSKHWKLNFPQDWFGKVIAYDKKNGFVIRCYRKRNKRDKQKHPHLRCKELKFIKTWTPK